MSQVCLLSLLPGLPGAAARRAVHRVPRRSSRSASLARAHDAWRLVHALRPGVVAVALACSAPAFAQQRVIDVDLPAQPLSAAIAQWSKQAEVAVVADAALLDGKSAPAVKGRFTPGESIARLLAGSGLEARADGGRWVIAAVPAAAAVKVAERAKAPPEEAELPPVVVQASAPAFSIAPPKPYAGGQVASGSRMGILGNTSVFDVPFSVRSYTNDLAKNLGALSVNEVMDNDPSVRMALNDGFVLDQLSIRGFVISSQSFRFDGMQGMYPYGSVAVQNYERIEIVKGPSALLFGSEIFGPVGGVVNSVLKRATDTPVSSITGFVRSRSLVGTHVDLGRRFGPDNALGVRLNVSGDRGDLYLDNASRESMAPQVALDYRGQRVRAVIDAGITTLVNQGQGLNMRVQPGVALPEPPDARINASPAWSTFNSRQNYALGTVEFDVTDIVTGYARYGWSRQDVETISPFGVPAFDAAGNFSGRPVRYRYYLATKTWETGIRAELQTGPVRHKLAVSATRLDYEYGDDGFPSFTSTVASNIFNPVAIPDPSGQIAITPVVRRTVDSLSSIAIADTLSMFDDRLALTLGLRRQRIAFDGSGTVYNEHRNTPAVALLGKVLPNLSLYASYTEGLSRGETAPLGTANQGQTLAPFQTKQMEVGAKWDLGRLGLTAAVFDIARNFGLVDNANRFVEGGQQRHRGLELEAFGELTRGVRVLGGVMFLDPEQRRTPGGATDGKRAVGVAEFQANAGLDFDIPGVSGMASNVRVIHTGDAFFDAANTVSVPAWTRVDLGVRYATKAGGYPLTLRANVNNVFDESYWRIAGRNIITVAAPRLFHVSATVNF
jgi:iron complex outermembrane receptor protein